MLSQLPTTYGELHQQYGAFIQVSVNDLNKGKHNPEDVNNYIWLRLLQSRFLEHLCERLRTRGRKNVDVEFLTRNYLWVALKNSYSNFCRDYLRHQSKEHEVAPDLVELELERRLAPTTVGSPETMLALQEARSLLIHGIERQIGNYRFAVECEFDIYEQMKHGVSLDAALRKVGLSSSVRKSVRKFVRHEPEEGIVLVQPPLIQSARELRRLERKAILDQLCREIAEFGHVLDVVPPETPSLLEPSTNKTPAPEPHVEMIREAEEEHMEDLDWSTTQDPTADAAPSGTVPERIAAAMGSEVMTASDVMAATAAAGMTFNSGNLRSYVSTTLNSADRSVAGPDGQPLRYRDGRLLKVHRFAVVERGHYRVATAGDIEKEVQRKLEADKAKPKPKKPAVSDWRQDLPSHRRAVGGASRATAEGSLTASVRRLYRLMKQEDQVKMAVLFPGVLTHRDDQMVESPGRPSKQSERSQPVTPKSKLSPREEALRSMIRQAAKIETSEHPGFLAELAAQLLALDETLGCPRSTTLNDAK